MYFALMLVVQLSVMCVIKDSSGVISNLCKFSLFIIAPLQDV